MAQHDYNLANQSGADFRADLNNALSAIATTNSGATSPSTTFAHQLWVDTANSVLKIRNSANDAWITTGVSITADNTFTGNITGNASTATALETARTINGVSFDGTANISFDTDSVSQGSSNLYFTNARVESYLDAGTATPTFASAVINSSLTGSAVLDDDTFGTASATTVATSESIKAYVDSQVGSVDTLAEILLNGNTTGGTDIAFGDNDKAIFGTGSDLQIFHNSANNHSVISEAGTGDLRISASNLVFLNSAATETKASFTTNGAVELYYDNAKKFETTSTGIDVTGEVQADTHFTSSDLVATLSTSGSGGSVYLRPNGQTQSSGQAVLDTSGNLDVTGTVTADGVGLAAGSTISSAGGLLVTIDDNNNTSSTYFEINADGTSKSIARFVENGDISFFDDTGTTQGLFWDASAESLGVGTTSPSSTLHLRDTTAQIKINSDNGQSAYLTFGDANDTTRGGLEYTSTDDLKFQTNNMVEQMVIRYTGEVGIGTSSPSNPLHVYHATTDTVANFESGDASVAVNFTASDNSMQITTSGTDGIIKNNGAGSFRLFNNGSERVRIDSNGKLGVNTTSLDGILTLKQLANSDSNGLDGIRIDASTGTTYAGFGLVDATGTLAITAGDAGGTNNTAITFRTASSGSEAVRARIDSSGIVMIGTTSTTIDSSNQGINLTNVGRIKNSVNVAGGGIVTQMYGTAGEFRVKGDGDAENTNNSYGAISDERLKENIADATPKLEKLKQVQVKTFNLVDSDLKQIGVIAQELESIFPSLVKDNDDGYKTVKYSVFVPILIKSIQEQQEQIESLKSEIAKLKGE